MLLNDTEIDQRIRAGAEEANRIASIHAQEYERKVSDCEKWGGRFVPPGFASGNYCSMPWKKWALYGGIGLVVVVLIVALKRK